MANLSATVNGWTAEIEIPTQAIVWEWLKYDIVKKAIIAEQQIVAVGMLENTADVTAQLDALDGLLNELEAHFPTIPRVSLLQE